MRFVDHISQISAIAHVGGHDSLLSLKRGVRTILLLSFILGCSATKTTRYVSKASLENHTLDNVTLGMNASAGPLLFKNARVVTDNDEAFADKLELIRNAKYSLDLAYYIYSTDYSSSVVTNELIKAAQRGVKVQLLVDYFSNYPNLDLFSMMEKYGNQGRGSLHVRFYNRPTDIILKDAVYVTLGCEEVDKFDDLHGCSKAKFDEIKKRYHDYLSSFPAKSDGVPTNFSNGWSSIFLSGLYAKDPKLMAFALINGQQIDLSAAKNKPESKSESKPETSEEKAKKYSLMLKAGTIYWKSRTTNDHVLERVAANIKLSLAFTLFGTKLNPLYDMITAYLPVGERPDTEAAIRDWDFLTEFLHHKFLLADGQHLMIGGRNIEDSYHMVKNPLVDKYVFLDTDLRIDLAEPTPSLDASYEKLWNFRTMVADLADIHEHAPIDFLEAVKRVRDNCGVERIDKVPVGSQLCVNSEFMLGVDEDLRIEAAHRAMLEHAETYHVKYSPALQEARSPSFPVDDKAELYYLENLPFERNPLKGPPVRNYGGVNGLEGESGKYLHSVWLAGLRNACAVATENYPQEVILHSAYFFLPSNLLRQLGEMIDGTLDCSHVRITVLTNSESTTDLRIINLAARSSMKAFADYYAEKRDLKRGAVFRAFVYNKQGTNEKRSDASLHSKVSVLGPDMIIGSANADARSYMLDSNNGVFIRNAPVLHNAYCAWVEQILQTPGMTTDAFPLLADVSFDELLRRDVGKASSALSALAGTSSDGAEPAEPFVSLLKAVLTEDYNLSKKIVRGGFGGKKAEERFNSFFKLL